MEAYPPQYIEHDLPLVLLSGLGHEQEDDQPNPQFRRQESGARITIESAESHAETSKQLLSEFMALDGRASAWNATSLPGPSSAIRYRMKTIGRTYTLPARKAAPLPQSPGAEGSPHARNTELHSPLSPLSPGSPVFPDGVFTPLWFTKHQRQVPAIFLAFFELNAGESASQDEQIKSDINAIRTALGRSGFRSRLAVVLISDQSILHAPELEDRLGAIRRATSLDPKNGFFFMPPMSSQAEIATFVQSTMAALQPLCIEYYRDLTKHARRKKARGGAPPSIHSPIGGASQSTSTSGWNVRYEIKQGCFAEMRQEMDVAERHYSAAIEELFSSEGGVLETTASWNPRFDDARLICDAIAIRVIKCQLWTGQTTGAAQSWQNYKLRMKDLIDRRGKGSNTYGWDAWEARWAQTMSQLIQMADVPTLRKSVKDAEGNFSAQQIYALPERAVERLPPFNFLHHPGYYLRLLANHIRLRWEKASSIPEEDCVPPNQSPASTVANRAKNYDVYLVPEPHEEAPMSRDSTYDHAAEIAQASLLAAEEFEARRQIRASELVRLELASDLVRVGRYADARRVLVQLWENSTWRDEEWHVPFARLLQLLSECVTQQKTAENASLVPALTWELLHVAPHMSGDRSLDLSQCLDAWDTNKHVNLRLHDRQSLSPIKPAFAFRVTRSHVGETVECQITLDYDTAENAAPLRVSKLAFKLGSKQVLISDKEDTEAGFLSLQLLSDVTELESGLLGTTADLRLLPSRSKVLNLSVPLREAQIISISEMSLVIETSRFTLAHVFEDSAIQPSRHWCSQTGDEIHSILLPHLDTKSLDVLPKPPKMQVRLHGLRKQFYTDEHIQISVELVNDESEAVHATVVPKIIGSNGETTPFKWKELDDEETVWSKEQMKASESDQAVLSVLGPPEEITFTMTVDLRYTLVSDPNTPLSKTVSVEMVFVQPFEAKFTFAPRLHPDPWPSYFDPARTGSADSPDGVLQLWTLGAQLSSLVSKPISIKSVDLEEHEVHGDANCSIGERESPAESSLKSNGKVMSDFELVTQKHSLDDRRPSHLELSLVVTWSHADVEPATTKIAVPRLTIPTSEPRVLCTASRDASSDETVNVQYHLENSSAHFLTFALTMEASESFAFCGPKYRTLSLAPLSRHQVSYQLMLHEEGWISPNLQVVDSYYQKNLRVHPGGPNVSMDERRAIRVWTGQGPPPDSRS